jgi:hypothetical protein
VVVHTVTLHTQAFGPCLRRIGVSAQDAAHSTPGRSKSAAKLCKLLYPPPCKCVCVARIVLDASADCNCDCGSSCGTAHRAAPPAKGFPALFGCTAGLTRASIGHKVTLLCQTMAQGCETYRSTFLAAAAALSFCFSGSGRAFLLATPFLPITRISSG